MSRIITSPGVQFTEKDLSLRVGNPTGTSVVTLGFAAQGPTSEPILVTSLNELENIFGIPTTHAEKYLYHSCKQILNSPATLNVIRLPYGVVGSDFSSNFNGLFYPCELKALTESKTTLSSTPFAYSLTSVGLSSNGIQATATYNGSTVDVYETSIDNQIFYIAGGSSIVSGNTVFFSSSSLDVSASPQNILLLNVGGNTAKSVLVSINSSGIVSLSTSYLQDVVETVYTGQSAWEIGKPVTKNLTEEEFADIKRENFAWNSPTADEENVINLDLNGNFSSTGAGFFILNELQATINEIAEGYYVGFSTNEENVDFKSISSMYTLSANESLSLFDTSKLDFRLSSTKIEADGGIDSISENLENVGFIAYKSRGYQDHLSLGIYKIRKSLVDPSLLTITTTEKYLGSLNSTREVTSPNGGLVNAYLLDKVNNNSSVAKIYINPSLANFLWSENSTEPKHKIIIKDEAKALFPIGSFVPNSRDLDKTKKIGNVPLKLDKALRSIDSTEYFSCDIVVDAGLSTIYSVAKKIDSDADANFIEETGITESQFESLALNWSTICQSFVNFCENTRKDCIALLDPPRSIFVAGKDTKTLSLPGATFTLDVYNKLRSCFGTFETSYAASYANWLKSPDAFSGKQMWLPPSSYVAAAICTSDQNSNVWSAPAGLTRGLLSNVLDVAINPNQKMRDRIYELGLNPVVFFNGLGFSAFGQKTLQTKPTAFDRINVRRLFNFLERTVQKTIQYFVFEPNTSFTRQRVVATLSPVFNNAKANEGIYDYMIVCDERNNSSTTIDENEMVVDIYIKPVRTAEYILLNFVATRTNQNFNEIF